VRPPLALALALAVLASAAQAARPRADHPLLGMWEVKLPDGRCTETYQFKPDGSSLVTSAAEVAESEYAITEQPDDEGFYAMHDKLVRDNGKPDCLGEVMAPGHEVDRFILFHPSGKLFLMCEQAALDSCIGPFRRLDGEAT
jgi:hypothetical protein